eukprot:s5398_g3.t1
MLPWWMLSFASGHRVGVQKRTSKRRSPQMQVPQRPQMQPESNLPDSDMQQHRAGLAQEIKAILDEERRLDRLFAESGQKITLDSFLQAEPFPVDSSGKFVFRDVAMKERLSGALDDFFVYDAVRNHGRAQAIWPLLITTAYPFMEGWSLKDMMLAIIARTLSNRCKGRAWLDCVEYFAGRGALSREALRQGFRVCALDKEISDHHEVLSSSESLRLWFAVLSATRAGALVWHGTPCSSFSIMCRAVSKRKPENNWLGNEALAFVREGNLLADLSALTILLAYLCDCDECLEQSGTSVMGQTPSLSGHLAYIQAVRAVTYHACFGSASLKPLQVWSSKRMILSLNRNKPQMAGSGDELAVRSDNGAFTGDKTKLRESEHYTPLPQTAMATPLHLAPMLIHEDDSEIEFQNQNQKVVLADEENRHAKRQRAVMMLRVRYADLMPPMVLDEILPDPMQPSPKRVWEKKMFTARQELLDLVRMAIMSE